MTSEKRPRIRIASDGTTGRGGTGTKVEVITQHGAVIDISGTVKVVMWLLDANEGAAQVQLVLCHDAEVDLLGDLTDVIVEHSP